MPSIGETGWGQLVNQNFAILDSVSKIDSITTTFTTIDTTAIPITSFDQFIMKKDSSIQYAYIYCKSTAIPAGFVIQPTESLRYLIFYIDGNFTINGTINTYPVTLVGDLLPNTPATNTADILKPGILCNSLNILVSKNNNDVTMNIQEPYVGAYVDFNTRRVGLSNDIVVTIPHAIANGGASSAPEGNGTAGTAGTDTNTCNGGGGGGTSITNYTGYPGGTGCIYGQYLPNVEYGDSDGVTLYTKYRCAVIFIVNGNLTIFGSITQFGGDGGGINNTTWGGYGGGGAGTSHLSTAGGGGGGAPVFIYYTGTYTNNGTINTSGGVGATSNRGKTGGNGGAGGIKITKITL